MGDRPGGFDPAAFRAELRRAAYNLPGERINVSYCTTFCGDACTCSLAGTESCAACSGKGCYPDMTACTDCLGTGRLPAPVVLPPLPHEPTDACRDTHCYWHHVDESPEGAWHVCFECCHVYRTAEALREAWAEVAAADNYEMPPGADAPEAPPVEQIRGCPYCCHDW